MTLAVHIFCFVFVYLNAICLVENWRDGRTVIAGINLANVAVLSATLAGGLSS